MPESDPIAVPDPLANRLLILFDGRCALCHASVRWLLGRDHRDRLRFAPAESPIAQALLVQALLANSGVELSQSTSTILVLAPPDASDPAPRLLTRSAAILACLAALTAPWPQLAAIAQRIPLPLRDAAYRVIARLRYRLARRYDACPLPAPEDRAHFLA